MKTRDGSTGRIRYALVALGHIAQNAVLPGFLNARKNSELAALVSVNAIFFRAMPPRN